MTASERKPAYQLVSRLLLPLVAIFAAIGLAPTVTGQTDANINMSVWKMIYGVTDAQASSPTWLAADDDGDGVPNGKELIAGTNPFKSNSTLVVATMTSTATTISMTFPTVSQKLYTVQATQSLNPVSWSAAAGVFVVGDGTSKTLTATKGSNKYFRVVAQDQSTANDNVSDWAKQFLGFALGSPISAQSAYADNNALASALGGQNVVTVTATDASTMQPNINVVASTDLGTFTITRSGYFLLSQITVSLSAGGTAVAGTDYVALPSVITFPAGVKTQTISVVPKYNPARTTSTTVSLTLSGSSGFTVGTPASATVTIYPADLSYGTGLKGSYYTGSSSTYRTTNLGNNNLGGVAAVYSYTQNSSTAGTVTVLHGGLAPSSVGSLVYLSFTSGVGTPNLSTTSVLPSGTTGALYDKAYVVTSATNPGPGAVTSISGALITRTNHGLTAGTPVSFSTTGTLPTGLTTGTCKRRMKSAAGGTEWCGGRKVRHLQINHGGCSQICTNGPRYAAEF